MAINFPSITSQSASSGNFPSIIERLTTQPVAGDTFTPGRPPGQLAAYEDAQRGVVELYVVNSAGNRWLRVV